jgi:hypothetical protein
MKNDLPRAVVDNQIEAYVRTRISLPDMYRIIAQYLPSTQIMRCETNLQYTAELLVAQWKKDAKDVQSELKPKIIGYVHNNNERRKWSV